MTTQRNYVIFILPHFLTTECIYMLRILRESSYFGFLTHLENPPCPRLPVAEKFELLAGVRPLFPNERAVWVTIG